MCKTEDKLATFFVVKEIGGRANRRDRGYQLAEELVFGRETKSRGVLLESRFAARRALTQCLTDRLEPRFELTSIYSTTHCTLNALSGGRQNPVVRRPFRSLRYSSHGRGD